LAEEITKNYEQLEKFYKDEILFILDGMKDLVDHNKIPKMSVLSLAEFIDKWANARKENEERRNKNE